MNITNTIIMKRQGFGESKIFKWDYSKKSDILNIHKKNTINAGGEEFGDVDIEFDKQGNVIGIEMMWASEFLAPTGITKKQLEQLTNAEIVTHQHTKETRLIWIKLGIPGKPEMILPLPTVLTA